MTQTIDNVPQGWLDMARHMLSRCKNNKGIAVVEIKFLVLGNRPIMWLDADVHRVHPLEAGVYYPEYLPQFLKNNDSPLDVTE